MRNAISMTSRRTLLTATGGVALSTTLAACVSSLPGSGEGPRIFRLTPKTTFPDDLEPVDWSLAIAEPTAERALDTNRIARLQNGTQLDYVANASWSDRVPTMIQGLIVQSFRASGAIADIGTNRDRMRPDFMLRPKLNAFFFFESDDAKTARVALEADLLSMPRRQMLDRQSFEAEFNAGEGTVDELVIAFDQALGRTLKNLVLWTLEAGNTHFQAT